MPTREQLRLARTKFVHRWHAAQTIRERLGNDAVGERFEHINHARSLAEYVWRYGVFEESGDGTGRVARQDMPYGLRDVVAPVAARGANHLRMAARYALIAAGLGRDETDSSDGGRTSVPVAAERQQLLRYAEQHPEIKLFAAGIIALHRGMLQYYVQMRYLTPVEAERYRTGAMPLFAPLPRPGASAVRESSADADASIGDPVAALRGAFARNLYNALVARAQSELLETVARHPDGRDPCRRGAGTHFAPRAPGVHDDSHRAAPPQAVRDPRRSARRHAAEPRRRTDAAGHPLARRVQDGRVGDDHHDADVHRQELPARHPVRLRGRALLAGSHHLDARRQRARHPRSDDRPLRADARVPAAGRVLLGARGVGDARRRRTDHRGGRGRGQTLGSPTGLSADPPGVDRRSRNAGASVPEGPGVWRDQLRRRPRRAHDLRRLRQHRRLAPLAHVRAHGALHERRRPGLRPAIPDRPAAPAAPPR